MRIVGIKGLGAGFALAVGVLCTTVPSQAAGSEDGLAKGQSLRRSGKENEALTELRRAKAGTTGDRITSRMAMASAHAPGRLAPASACSVASSAKHPTHTVPTRSSVARSK
jgi:hypothetical protein